MLGEATTENGKLIGCTHLHLSGPKVGQPRFLPTFALWGNSEFEENAGISLQSAPKLSANGPTIPQKYSQRDEDVNFRFEKFPSAALQNFLRL